MEQQDALVGEMGLLIQEIVKQRGIVEEKKNILKQENEVLNDLEGKALSLLEQMKLKSYPSPFGTVTSREHWRVNVPQGENREKFFSYLKEKGLEEMLTINSQTLNSFFNKEWAAAIERGEALDFSIPGIDEPKRHVTLSLQKGRT